MNRTKNTIVTIAAVVLLAGGVVLGTGEINAEGDTKKPSQQTSSVREGSRSETSYSLEQEDSDSGDGVLGDVLSDLERHGAWDADESQDEITADVLGITIDELGVVREGGDRLEALAEDGGYQNADEYLRTVRDAMDETGFHLVDN